MIKVSWLHLTWILVFQYQMKRVCIHRTECNINFKSRWFQCYCTKLPNDLQFNNLQWKSNCSFQINLLTNCFICILCFMLKSNKWTQYFAKLRVKFFTSSGYDWSRSLGKSFLTYECNSGRLRWKVQTGMLSVTNVATLFCELVVGVFNFHFDSQPACWYNFFGVIAFWCLFWKLFRSIKFISLVKVVNWIYQKCFTFIWLSFKQLWTIIWIFQMWKKRSKSLIMFGKLRLMCQFLFRKLTKFLINNWFCNSLCIHR